MILFFSARSALKFLIFYVFRFKFFLFAFLSIPHNFLLVVVFLTRKESKKKVFLIDSDSCLSHSSMAYKAVPFVMRFKSILQPLNLKFIRKIDSVIDAGVKGSTIDDKQKPFQSSPQSSSKIISKPLFLSFHFHWKITEAMYVTLFRCSCENEARFYYFQYV